MPITALSSAELSTQAEVLFSVLGAASGGNDVSHTVSELLQDVLQKPAANAQLRKLAYEVCRHSNLTNSDCYKLWQSITGDANNGDPEVVATALRYLTCFPSSQLADRFVIGQLSELLKPGLAAEAAVVRAAAVQALSRVLLLPEVQQAASNSAGLANAYEGLWDELMDSLLDERAFVVGQAAAATAKLLASGIAGTSGFSGMYDDAGGGAVATGTTSDASSLVGFMMCRFADRAAMRLSAALGPVLEMCGMVPAPGQVAVCEMLLALTRRLLTHPLREAATGAAPPIPPSGVPMPNLASLVSSVASYLATQLQSGDAVARTEACGAILELAADLAAAGPAAGGAAAGLPQALLLGAVDVLMQLREREFVEAGLGDICEAIADALPALLPAARADVLRMLWPLASRIDDVSRRARVFSLAWKVAVSSEMDYRTDSGRPQRSSGALGLPAVLPAPPSSKGSDPRGLLADLTLAPAAGAGAGGAGSGQAAGVVTVVSRSCRVSAMLGDQFVCAILSNKAPPAESSGTFSVAQASAAMASAPLHGAAPSSSSSLLSGVVSMTRPAPPPPPSPLSVLSPQHADSTLDSGKGAKAEKERKSVFAGRLFRTKAKAQGDHGSAVVTVATATAAQQEEEEEAARKAEAAAAAAAAAAASQRAAATPPSPKPPLPPGSANGAVSTSSMSGGGSIGDVSAAVLTRPPLSYATLRHELLQCLLHQLAYHPAAAVAAELCAEHVAAARHDRNPPTRTATIASSSSSSAASLAHRVSCTVQWVAMSSEVLTGSAACVGWEPYVMPAITANPNASPTGCVPVDFNNLTADLWLGVLQATLQAARSAQALLGRMVVEAEEAAAAADAAGTQTSTFTGLGYGMPYGLAAGGPAAAVQQQQQLEVTAEAHYRALLSYLKERADVLQGLLLKLLSNFAGLSASVRPRVAWVASHCLALPGHWDRQWELMVECLDALLVRGTDVLAASRRHDLLGSALAGGLFRAGRQAWTDPTKPFLFDIASASALCEAPEYEVLGLLVGLASLQQLAARLVNAVADAVLHGTAGTAHSQAAAVAKQLEAVLRRFIGTEVAAAPHVRDWCKRILRNLATLMAYTPPVNLPPLVAALGIIAKQEHGADGAAHDGDGDDDDDDSSDASSGYQPTGGQPELPPALAAAAAAAVAAAAAAASTQAHQHQAHGRAAAAHNGNAANGEAAAEDGGTAADEAAKKRTAPGNSYLVASAAAALPTWGYPFAPLSAIALHNSKRARRHRALSRHLAAAAVAAEAPRPVLAAALRPLQPSEDDATAAAAASPTSGPALSSHSSYRLDSEAFWTALPNTHSSWQELTGPADPLLLRGCYARPGLARGDATTITIMLSAVNRLPFDISDVEVSLKTNGLLLSNTRRTAVWELPRLAAHDRAVASFTFTVLGYGDMQLHARLQLCRGPPRTDCTPLQLACLPLEVPVVVLFRLPRPLPEAAEFFRSWGTLPARTELSGVCTWPGPEGAALLLSALLRQPLACSWLQHVPAVYGFQAAFTADTALGDNLALVVTTQLMPPAVPGGSSETLCTFSIRSTSPDLILSLQSGAAAWLAQLTSGTASLGGAGRSAQPAASAKPPLHPRVAALLQSYSASVAQLESALTPMASYGLSAALLVGTGTDAAAARGTANGLNTVLLKNVALQEWQRLQRLAV